jgi:bla regulator protein blaR1
MSRNLNLLVVDRTGLAGAFNFTLHWNPNDASVQERDEAFAILGLEMSKAIVKQLGLSLKSRKMPVEVLVIDHAEKPSATDN